MDYAQKEEKQNDPRQNRSWNLIKKATHSLYKDGWTQNTFVTIAGIFCSPFIGYLLMSSPKGMLYGFGIGLTIALWVSLLAIGKHIGTTDVRTPVTTTDIADSSIASMPSAAPTEPMPLRTEKIKESSQPPQSPQQIINAPNVDNRGGFMGFNNGGTVNLGLVRRIITPDQENSMLRLLADSPKGKVQMTAIESDQEAVAFLQKIESILKKSGFQVEVGLAMMLSGPRGAPVGLCLTIKDSNAVPPHAQAIGDAMAKIGLNPLTSINPDRAPDVLYITVGAKPLEP